MAYIILNLSISAEESSRYISGIKKYTEVKINRKNTSRDKYNLVICPKKLLILSNLHSAIYLDTKRVTALPNPKSKTNNEIIDVAKTYRP